MSHILLGQTLQFTGSPFAEPVEAVTRHLRHGAVGIHDGRIVEVGDASQMRAAHPKAEVTDMGTALLLPGFVDAHAHFPQTRIIASWGKQLLDWLQTYTFPEEARFHDPAYAREVARAYLDACLAHGITSAASFCTIHPESVDALFTEAEARGMRIAAGRVMMDRNDLYPALQDSVQSAHDESAALIAKWHGRGRLTYAVTPRFSLTSTREQLEMAGALWAAHPGTLMQTHLSEQVPEIARMHELFPEAQDYLSTYETRGLIGPGAMMGHAIHLEPREIAVMRDTGTGVVHCPTSNMFIGSGLCDVAGLIAEGIPVGLATDVGGGSSFSMLHSMAAAYEVGQLRGTALHPAQLLWLATAGSAGVMRMGDKIGTLAPGYEADIIALNLSSTPIIAGRAARADDIWEALFPTIMMGDDRAVAGVWVGGKSVSRRV
ncbi:guanine deaminase [Rubricella aquisinus]|uniref:guanine deaminase n=1 Tax=Rubricella aquisinus TaxID=2028108 RepID=UPI003CCCF9B5